ncbi:PDZ domain-containing protein [bacterium]|nr:PDZ domain-containing protein [bacterium]NUN45863.1 PD40 domain-containing protein [bacterium]
MKRNLWLCLWFALFTLSSAQAQQESRLMRFPATDGQQIVFTYAGDLYTVPVNGGLARKLTSDANGYEMFARFSPNGQWLAFSGQYDGNTEVYVMPSGGGVPKRLTITATLGRDDVADRMGPSTIVMAWKNTSEEILFRSRMRSFNDWNGELFSVNLQGDALSQVPVPRGGWMSFSPDDKKMAYNRIFREFRTWKRYRGGMADDVWIYDFASKTVENITNNNASDLYPMWVGNKIYFVSDRDARSRFNLYSYDITSKTTTQLTTFTDFDIKFPSLGKDAIVFENGGYIYRFDLKTEKATKVPISIQEDFASGRNALLQVGKNVTNFEISPDGKRALLGAHGEIFTVPSKAGITRNLTQTSGTHERASKWSPDGKWIAFIGDASGENEIYIMPQDGSAKPTPITKNADTYYYTLYWSPDSKKILWADKKLRLRYVDVATKNVTEVDQATFWEFSEYTWSPDSKWIAYTRPEDAGMSRVMLYSLDQKKSTEITDGWYESGSPAFSHDGKYLIFGSNRDFNPVYSWTEWNHSYQDMTRIYMVTLSKETDSPFKPKNDEVEIKKDDQPKADDKAKKDDAGKKADASVKIDLDGIKQRLIVLPVSASNYYNLAGVDDKIYYSRQGSKDEKPLLFVFDLKEQKETELGSFNGYEISADNKKMLVGQSGSFAIVDLPKGKIEFKDKLDLGNMEMRVNYREEWMQIFNECWRQMRDFLYDPALHGVDWEGVRKKYAPLVEHVNHRNDLTYIIGEVIGELNIGHAYVGGGERKQPRRINLGLLGAEIERDPATKYYRIARILPGENWRKEVRSPLTEVGVNVNSGDYIIAINGQSVAGVNNINELLINTADKTTLLKVNSKPSEQGARDVAVTPIADEADLYYYQWVQTNIEKVNKATNGEVGYIHVPDMGVNGLNEFVKHFYPQLRKKALIIDVRGNGGGNVSPMLIERLRREIAMVDAPRNLSSRPDPFDMMVGPMVCLLNEFSASDGDLFPYRFRKMKLGKLIGKRSWGGVVGIRGSLPLVDGGYLNRPEFGSYDTDGKEWIIEGHGVDPDIVIDNDPAREFAGIDDQLTKGIEVIMEELKTKKRELPKKPEYPKK